MLGFGGRLHTKHIAQCWLCHCCQHAAASGDRRATLLRPLFGSAGSKSFAVMHCTTLGASAHIGLPLKQHTEHASDAAVILVVSCGWMAR
jgi:hypothetical protein